MLQHNESKNLLKTLSLSSSALPRESFFSFETYSAIWAKVTVTIGLARSILLQNLQLPSHCFESAFCIAVIWYFDMAFCRPQSRNLLVLATMAIDVLSLFLILARTSWRMI